VVIVLSLEGRQQLERQHIVCLDAVEGSGVPAVASAVDVFEHNQLHCSRYAVLREAVPSSP
jgi:hypothetical protein